MMLFAAYTRRRRRPTHNAAPPPPPSGPTVVVSDSFNRADNAASLGAADTGQAWTAHSGTWGIIANEAYVSASAAPNAATVDAGVADCSVQMTVSGMNGQPILLARYIDANNHLQLYANTTSGNWILRKVVAGVTTNVASTTITPAGGDVAELVLSGDQVEVKINGASQLVATIPELVTATRHGMMARLANVTGFRIDDFSVTTG